MEIGIVGILADKAPQVVFTHSQVIAQSLGTRIQIGGSRTMAQVAVHHQHPLALQGKSGGGIHGEESLAATRIERGIENDAGLFRFIGFKHELQIGAQHTESLVDDITAALLDDERLGL